MIKLRLILGGALLLLGLVGCNTGTTPPPGTTPAPGESAAPGAVTQPTSSVTSIPESDYPAPYPSPSSLP